MIPAYCIEECREIPALDSIHSFSKVLKWFSTQKPAQTNSRVSECPEQKVPVCFSVVR